MPLQQIGGGVHCTDTVLCRTHVCLKHYVRACVRCPVATSLSKQQAWVHAAAHRRHWLRRTAQRHGSGQGSMLCVVGHGGHELA